MVDLTDAPPVVLPCGCVEVPGTGELITLCPLHAEEMEAEAAEVERQDLRERERQWSPCAED